MSHKSNAGQGYAAAPERPSAVAACSPRITCCTDSAAATQTWPWTLLRGLHQLADVGLPKMEEQRTGIGTFTSLMDFTKAHGQR